jgi:hypothetical protein
LVRLAAVQFLRDARAGRASVTMVVRVVVGMVVLVAVLVIMTVLVVMRVRMGMVVRMSPLVVVRMRTVVIMLFFAGLRLGILPFLIGPHADSGASEGRQVPE